MLSMEKALPQTSRQVLVRPDEHVFIGGRTGGGKTWLLRKYLSGYEPVAVLDTKGLFKWPEVDPKELTVVTRITNLNRLRTPKVIYRPRFEELSEEYYDAFFFWAYRRQNTIVGVDEAMQVAPGSSAEKLPAGYKAILTRGREIGVSVWSCSQRPSGIPQQILSESTHFFTFDLNLSTDRDKLGEIAEVPELRERPGKTYVRGKPIPNFWYVRMGDEHARKAYLIERGG